MFSTKGLKNPVFGIPGVSVRDPAAIWHNGACHLFYSRQTGDWNSRASWDIGMVTTRDFREFSSEQCITPKGYASPGNIVRAGDQWVMPVQSYPWPSDIALLFSHDLVHWSPPRHIIPADHGVHWDVKHGPIDGWLFSDGGLWHCVWVNTILKTDHRTFGVSVSRDLIQWKLLTPEEPLIDGSAYRADGGVENCSIFKDGDTWHFFASVGMTRQRLAHVASQDPLRWPPLTTGTEIALPVEPWCAHSQEAVFVDDWRAMCDRYAMLYHGLETADGHGRVGLAVSDDLWNWTTP